MPQVKIFNRSHFRITAENGIKSYFHDLVQTISMQYLNPEMCDVRIRCNDGITLYTSQQILSQGSLFFRNLFSQNCECSSYLPIVYDILCPDFNSYVIDKVLDLIKTGEATFECLKDNQVRELKAVIATLQISVPFLIDDNCVITPEDIDLVELGTDDEEEGNSHSLEEGEVTFEAEIDDDEENYLNDEEDEAGSFSSEEEIGYDGENSLLKNEDVVEKTGFRFMNTNVNEEKENERESDDTNIRTQDNTLSPSKDHHFSLDELLSDDEGEMLKGVAENTCTDEDYIDLVSDDSNSEPTNSSVTNEVCISLVIKQEDDKVVSESINSTVKVSYDEIRENINATMDNECELNTSEVVIDSGERNDDQTNNENMAMNSMEQINEIEPINEEPMSDNEPMNDEETMYEEEEMNEIEDIKMSKIEDEEMNENEKTKYEKEVSEDEEMNENEKRNFDETSEDVDERTIRDDIWNCNNESATNKEKGTNDEEEDSEDGSKEIYVETSSRSQNEISLDMDDAYKCYLCPSYYLDYNKLLLHIGNIHCKRQIINRFGKKNKLGCLLCSLTFPTTLLLVDHLVGPKHSVLMNIIPEKAILKQRVSPKLVSLIRIKRLNPQESSKATEKSRTSFADKASTVSNKSTSKNPSSADSDASGSRKVNGKESGTAKSDAAADSHLYACHICDIKYKLKPTLILHYWRVHFNEKLDRKKLFNVNSKGIHCKLCAGTFQYKSKLLCHLVMKHNCLRGLVPADLIKGEKTLDSRQKNHLSPPPTLITSMKLRPLKKKPDPESTKKESDQKSGSFNCTLCEREFSSNSSRMFHYSNTHFAEQIEAMRLNTNNTCNICNYKAKKRSNLYNHLASKHDCLKNFIQKNVASKKGVKKVDRPLTSSKQLRFTLRRIKTKKD